MCDHHDDSEIRLRKRSKIHFKKKKKMKLSKKIKLKNAHHNSVKDGISNTDLHEIFKKYQSAFQKFEETANMMKK